MKSLIVLLALVLSPLAHATTLNFAWDASPDPTVTGYNLYAWTPPASPTVAANCGNIAATTCSVTIQSGIPYSFSVTAVNNAGLESDFSNTLQWWEMFQTPIKLVSVTGGGINLVWTEGPNFVSGYQVNQGVGSGTNITWASTNLVLGYTNNFEPVSGLVHGTNFFRVRALFPGDSAIPTYASDYSATTSISPPRAPTLRILLPSQNILQVQVNTAQIVPMVKPAAKRKTP